MKVLYFALEKYRERYTELLGGWTLRQMRAEGVEVVMRGSASTQTIERGRVLDAGRRSTFAMAQIKGAIEEGLLDDPELDWVYLDDMFHPGFEALPYYRHVTGARWRIAARNWAQSVDVYDFTWPMRSWMRPYEMMVNACADLIFCGSEIHKEHMLVAGYDERKVHAVGLPYDAESVRGLALPGRDDVDVVYTSRLDAEKQPGLMLAIAAEAWERLGWTTTICSGAPHDVVGPKVPSEGTWPAWLSLAAELTKGEYYRKVRSAKVHLNTSLQDYVSFGLLDASAMGTQSALPCFRSFPEETVPSACLYRPGDVSDAIRALGESTRDWAATRRPAEHHSGTVRRCVDLMQEHSAS